MELIFFIELLLQISVVVILGLGLWIVKEQIKIANEQFKTANEQFKTANEQIHKQFKTANEQIHDQFTTANEQFKTANEQIHDQFTTANEQFKTANEQIHDQFTTANENFKSLKTLDGQVEELQKTLKEQCLWNKRSGALAYSLFKSDTLRNAKIRLDNAFGNLKDQGKLPLKTIQERVKKESGIETDIQTVLGHWENMALAIDNNVADEDVAFSMVANQVKLYHNAFKEFIDDIREIYPQRYAHLTELHKRWQKRLGGIESSNQNTENN